jgi:hypothetical protein
MACGFALNDAFLSVVSDQQDPTRLLVRARRKEALLAVCGKDVEVIESTGADYRWREFVDRKLFSVLVAARIEAISYDNFKHSVADDDLHELYMRFWGLHRHYQETDGAARTRTCDSE